jgi:hypothetical protein
LAGFIPQHNSVNGPRGLRRGDSAVGIFHKVELIRLKEMPEHPQMNYKIFLS